VDTTLKEEEEEEEEEKTNGQKKRRRGWAMIEIKHNTCQDIKSYLTHHIL
jgi:hypothetical protein